MADVIPIFDPETMAVRMAAEKYETARKRAENAWRDCADYLQAQLDKEKDRKSCRAR